MGTLATNSRCNRDFRLICVRWVVRQPSTRRERHSRRSRSIAATSFARATSSAFEIARVNCSIALEEKHAEILRRVEISRCKTIGNRAIRENTVGRAIAFARNVCALSNWDLFRKTTDGEKLTTDTWKLFPLWLFSLTNSHGARRSLARARPRIDVAISHDFLNPCRMPFFFFSSIRIDVFVDYNRQTIFLRSP